MGKCLGMISKWKTKLKRYFLNEAQLYTRWGLVVNYLIFVGPLVLIGLTFGLANVVEKALTTGANNLNFGDGLIILFWLTFLVVSIYATIYKIIHYFYRPKKVREAMEEYLLNHLPPEDKYWED